MSFLFKVESDNVDGLRFFVDGVEMMARQGDIRRYTEQTFPLTIGRHVLQWSYHDNPYPHNSHWTSTFTITDTAFIKVRHNTHNIITPIHTYHKSLFLFLALTPLAYSLSLSLSLSHIIDDRNYGHRVFNRGFVSRMPTGYILAITCGILHTLPPQHTCCTLLFHSMRTMPVKRIRYRR